MLDFTVAYDKLAQFETSDDIATYLRDAGIKGVPSKARSCPIAKYMQCMTGKMTVVSNCIYPLYPRATVHELTPAMVDFTCLFDCGKYPDLIVEGCSVYAFDFKGFSSAQE